MKSIIEQIYYGNISGCDIKVSRQLLDKELELYNELSEKLSIEDNKLFNNFIEQYVERNSAIQCGCYKLGFKTGLLLGIEMTQKEDL